ncbi:MAG TPA: hypothetical protein VEJ67_15060 [Candidatus Cybelea sp.]|nr:hypothetical protein [Candidatus Cybelea sp.]
MQEHIPAWQLTIGWGWYLLLCALTSVILRVVIFLLRACAVVRGDFPDGEREPGKEHLHQSGKGWTFRRAFWECFKGFGKYKAHADLWLNWIIGFVELAAYPVLIRTEAYTIIGGWLLIRAAGAWGGWSISRTSYNRHLFNILLELTLAYFWLSRYVELAAPIKHLG